MTRFLSIAASKRMFSEPVQERLKIDAILRSPGSGRQVHTMFDVRPDVCLLVPARTRLEAGKDRL